MIRNIIQSQASSKRSSLIRELSTLAIFGLVLSVLSVSPSHATTPPLIGLHPCMTGETQTGTFTVAAKGSEIVVTTHSNCVGHATIPHGVTQISWGFNPEFGFSGASFLTSVSLPVTLKTIGNSAFRETSITSLVIPDGVTSIQSNAFQQAMSLTSVTIPGSVIEIRNAAFSASAVMNVTFLGSPPPTVGSNGIFVNIPAGARALVSRAHIGTGAGKFGNIGDNWFGLMVSVATATLSLNSEGVITTQLVEETVAPTSPQLSRAGFTLQGWSATQGGAAAFQADLSDFTMGPTATSLFAVWEPVAAIVVNEIAVVENVIAEEETPVTQFSGPLLSGFDKRSIAQDSPTSITFRGKRMNQVLSATVDGVAVAIESSSRTQLTIAIGAMKPGTYTLVLQSRSGSMTLSRFLVVR